MKKGISLLFCFLYFSLAGGAQIDGYKEDVSNDLLFASIENALVFAKVEDKEKGIYPSDSLWLELGIFYNEELLDCPDVPDDLSKLADDLADGDLKALLKSNPEKTHAWNIIRDSDFSTDIASVEKIHKHLEFFDEAVLPSRRDELRLAFEEAPNKTKFVDGFIGGPLHLNELEQLNRLRNIQQLNGGVLNETQLAELNMLTDLVKLKNYKYPLYVAPNIGDLPLLDNVLPDFPQESITQYFRGKFKVEADKIIGFKDGDYDYVLMPNGELRIGHGHAHLSGNEMKLPAAGGITIYNNKIVGVTGQSGHYRPTDAQLVVIQDFLTNIGLF